MSMIKTELYQRRFFFLFLLIVVISAAGLTGCNSEQELKLHELSRKISTDPKRTPGLSFKGINIQPIEVTEGSFYRAEGWLSNQTIVYITNNQRGSNIYTHNFGTGKSELLFEANHPVVTIRISPSREFLFIHTAPSTYVGEVTVIDIDGNILFASEVPSTELSFEWNPYNEDLIAVTAFKEDWTYDSYLMNHKDKTFNKISVAEPFVNWLSEDEFVFLNWEQNAPTFFGTVAKSRVDSLEITPIGDETFRVFGFRDVLMLITVIPPDGKEMTYTFLDSELREINSFKVPNLTRFSDWLVPEFDFSMGKKVLYTFRPHQSGEADMYNDGFELIEYRVDSGDEVILFSDLNNEPIQCSPDGTKCLYGFQLEKLLLLSEAKVLKILGQ